jgi:hypothetical protein
LRVALNASMTTGTAEIGKEIAFLGRAFSR